MGAGVPPPRMDAWAASAGCDLCYYMLQAALDKCQKRC